MLDNSLQFEMNLKEIIRCSNSIKKGLRCTNNCTYFGSKKKTKKQKKGVIVPYSLK